MVLILDGHSEIGAHVCSDIDFLVCMVYIYRKQSQKSDFFLHNRPTFLHMRAIYSELPSNINTMGPNVMVSRERERKSYFPHAFNWNFATGGIDYLACTATWALNPIRPQGPTEL